MNVQLPEELAQFLRSEVILGHFTSENDALVEAVRLLRVQSKIDASAEPLRIVSDSLLGAWRDAATEFDEAVADAMNERERQPWRLPSS